MKIYTKTGDRGETGLWGGKRVSKDDPRVRAYGDVDELNCALGAALAALGKNARLTSLRNILARIQEECFIIGTLLASPADKIQSLAPPFNAGVPARSIAQLESEIDSFTRDLPPLKKFIMPGGSPAGAALHLARAVCRRAERRAVALSAREAVPDNVVVYLNRLSDHLFTAARWANARLGAPETPWQGLAAR